ncbi:MAG: molybdate ABC transporter substrate-binding protein [Pseudodesulfovibrio sp.]
MLKKSLLIFCWLCVMAGPAQPATLSIACAANFTSTMQELAALYEKESDVEITCAFGSTGMIYGQIKNGAPYDLFFAADTKRPQLLFNEGTALAPVIYAKGHVVAWSASTNLSSMPNWKEAVSSEAARRVGIANAKTAPYGLEAEEALISAGLLDTIQPKLAFGKSVGAAFQYAYSGAADIAFVALSQALSDKGINGTYWNIPETQPIEQAACILKNGNAETASLFLEWLTSPEARAIKRMYGYE